MIIEDTPAIRNTLEEIASERSASDSANYHLLDHLYQNNPTLPFAKVDDIPHEYPFDRCSTFAEKQRMLAAILAAMTCYNVQKLDDDFFLQHSPQIFQTYRYMKKLDASLFRQDPYLARISLPLGKENDFLFGFQSYAKNKMFHYGEPVEDGCGEILKLAWFSEDAKYPYVTRNGKYFSSLSADRILSAQNLVKPVSQKVLILGCDLGYLPYLIHRKDSVSEVTVVEKDPQVISLFQDQILPQFDHPEKIHVVPADAYEFLKEDREDYRWIINDLYSESMAGVSSYLAMKKLEHFHKKAKYAYWIEESVLSNLKSAFLILAMSALFPEAEEHLLSDEEQGRNIVDALKPFTDSLHIQSNAQLKELFTSNGLRKFLTKQGKKLSDQADN